MLGVLFSSRSYLPMRSMVRANGGSAAFRWRIAASGSKPYAPSPSNRSRGLLYAPSIVSSLQLRGDAAVRRKSADLTAGRKHAMARHDDRERIATQRLTHRARRGFVAELRGNFAVRQRGAWRDGSRHRVDPLVKRRHAFHVQHDVRKIARLSAQQRDHVVDRALHFGRRRCLLRVGHPLRQSARASDPRGLPAAGKRARRVRPRRCRSGRSRCRTA